MGSWCGNTCSARAGAPISPVVMAEDTETAAATGSCRWCAWACAWWPWWPWGSWDTRSWRQRPPPPPPPPPPPAASPPSGSMPGRNDGSPLANTSLYTRRWMVEPVVVNTMVAYYTDMTYVEDEDEWVFRFGFRVGTLVTGCSFLGSLLGWARSFESYGCMLGGFSGLSENFEVFVSKRIWFQCIYIIIISFIYNIIFINIIIIEWLCVHCRTRSAHQILRV